MSNTTTRKEIREVVNDAIAGFKASENFIIENESDMSQWEIFEAGASEAEDAIVEFLVAKGILK